MANHNLFRVYKVGRISQRRKVLARNLTEPQAQRLVGSYPDSNRSMVFYSRQ